MEPTFTLEGVISLAKRGDWIANHCGCIYKALCAVQEPEMRLLTPQVEFLHDHPELFDQNVYEMVQIQTYGATAKYEGGATGTSSK